MHCVNSYWLTAMLTAGVQRPSICNRTDRRSDSLHRCNTVKTNAYLHVVRSTQKTQFIYSVYVMYGKTIHMQGRIFVLHLALTLRFEV
jgi:hypothetical protein